MRTSSGATAVQIAQKLRGIRTIIEHVGSAHTDAEVASLVLVARNRIHAGQATFDLDALTPVHERGGAGPAVAKAAANNTYGMYTGETKPPEI